MSATAFTAGNRPGGLTNEDEIRLLVCYIVSKRQNKLSVADILEAVTTCGVANYFECADALSYMQKSGHIQAQEGETLSITESGEHIITGLEDKLPQSVRDNVIEACDEYLQRKTNIGQHKVSIAPADGGYNVKCVIADLGTPVFSLELFAPTAESAQLIKDRFIQYGAKLYGDALKLLTQ